MVTESETNNHDEDDSSFDHAKWRKEKYLNGLKRLSREEAIARFEAIEKAIIAALLEAHEEFLEDLNTSYDIDAVIILGGWARMVLSDEEWVHEKSDLDIYTLSRQNPVSLPDDLADRIERKLRRKGIRISIDVIGDITYTDPKSIGGIERNRSMLKDPLLLVGARSTILDIDLLRKFINEVRINVIERIK